MEVFKAEWHMCHWKRAPGEEEENARESATLFGLTDSQLKFRRKMGYCRQLGPFVSGRWAGFFSTPIMNIP
jgi:hypothetical protein